MKVMFSESLAVLSTLEKFVLGQVKKKASMKFSDFIFFYGVITAYVLKYVYYQHGAASYFTFFLEQFET
jgi:hypothetical protein